MRGTCILTGGTGAFAVPLLLTRSREINTEVLDGCMMMQINQRTSSSDKKKKVQSHPS